MAADPVKDTRAQAKEQWYVGQPKHSSNAEQSSLVAIAGHVAL